MVQVPPLAELLVKMVKADLDGQSSRLGMAEDMSKSLSSIVRTHARTQATVSRPFFIHLFTHS